MENMPGGHVHSMPPPSMSPSATNGTGTMMGPMHRHRMMMHMTFYWGPEAVVLFTGWPGTRPGMYAVCLVFVTFLAVFVEWLSHSNLVADGSNRVASGIVKTLMHMIRMGLAYMVMLAVMSFNVGVFLAAIVGHALGFLLFGSGVFKTSPAVPFGKTSDLPPMSC
ncbi:hypothetical protein LguiA_012042 [Lonicera macranthoides]